jgi:outer membrane protein TolC
MLNSRSDVGLLLKNQTTASSVGLSLSYNLFNGGNIRRDVQMASLQSSMAEIAYKKALMEVKNSIFIVVKRWKTAQQQAALHKQALDQYQSILAISREAFVLGKYNRIELSQAQVQFETALTARMQYRLNALQYYHALQRLLGTE